MEEHRALPINQLLRQATVNCTSVSLSSWWGQRPFILQTYYKWENRELGQFVQGSIKWLNSVETFYCSFGDIWLKNSHSNLSLSEIWQTDEKREGNFSKESYFFFLERNKLTISRTNGKCRVFKGKIIFNQLLQEQENERNAGSKDLPRPTWHSHLLWEVWKLNPFVQSVWNLGAP